MLTYSVFINLKNVITIDRKLRGYASLRFRLGKYEGVQNTCEVIGQE